MKYTQYLIPFVIILIASSCNKDDPAPQSGINADSLITAWLDSANITATRDESGIYFYPVVENPSGSQVSQTGQVLSFYYSLLDLDSVFIATYQPSDGDSLMYKYASNAIFPIGIDEVIGVMRTGETYNFIMPQDQAYADASSISTSDGSGVVILQLSLTGILSEDNVNQIELDQIDEYIRVNDLNDTISVTIERIDTTFIGSVILSIDTTFNYQIDSVEYFSSGVRYKELSGGMGMPAQNGDTIVIDYAVEYLDGTLIASSSNFIYELGSGIPDFLIPGLEFGLGLMLPSERGLIIIPSTQGYRESAQIVPQSITQELIDAGVIPDYVADIAPYSPLVFNVTRIR